MDWRKRITVDPEVMGGRPCIRGMRFPVATLLQLLKHQTPEEILEDYPYLEREDLEAALDFAAYLAEGREVVHGAVGALLNVERYLERGGVAVEDHRVRYRSLP